MTDPTYPLFPIFAFIGVLLSIIPLPWHLQAWNSGTCYFMMWSGLACLNQFINSVVWASDAVNRAPVWCEISIRIMMASSVGLPAASLCINRRLYHIANVQSVSLGRAQKSRAIIIDSLICVLFPLIFVALQYVVQGHRFNIFQEIGCYPVLYNTLLTYFISCMWPVLIGLTSAVYCVLSLRAFSRRRLEFSQFINSNASSLTMSRYFRLMALAMTDILFTTPLAIFTIWLNATGSPIGPWRSWADTHFDYGRVELIPSILWKSDKTLHIAIEFTRWVAPLCAFVFFGFFGFADEAKKNYAKAFWFLARPFGLKPGSSPQSSKLSASIGQFSTPKTPMSAKSAYAPSTILPMYSPPPTSSFLPVLDIKRSNSTSKQPQPIAPSNERAPPYSLEKASDSDSDLGLDTPTLDSFDRFDEPTPTASSSPHYHSASASPSETTPGQRARFSWKDISLPSSGRRFSSYF